MDRFSQLLIMKRIQLALTEVRGYVVNSDERQFTTNAMAQSDDVDAALTIPLDSLPTLAISRERNYQQQLASFQQYYQLTGGDEDPNKLSQSYSHLQSPNRIMKVIYLRFAKTINNKKKYDDTVFTPFKTILADPKQMQQIDKLIIISEIPLKPKQMAMIEGIRNFHPEVFLYHELLVHPLEHSFAEKVQVREIPEGIVKEELPKLLATNAISKFYGWEKGTVVKFSRTPIVASGFKPLPSYRVVK